MNSIVNRYIHNNIGMFHVQCSYYCSQLIFHMCTVIYILTEGDVNI